jgi:hypothetical protein
MCSCCPLSSARPHVAAAECTAALSHAPSRRPPTPMPAAPSEDPKMPSRHRLFSPPLTPSMSYRPCPRPPPPNPPPRGGGLAPTAAPDHPRRARAPTSPPGLRFGPNCDPAPAGGAPRPQPGTRPHSAPQGTHFPEHNQVWPDRVGRGPNHRLPWPPQPPRGWSPAAGSAEKAPSWEPVMLWKSLLSS